MAIEVAKIELKHVRDASGLEERIAAKQFAADEVIAVLGKTEGNGGVNDFTRLLADSAFRFVLQKYGKRKEHEVARIPMVWSGGCDGVLTPHATVFAKNDHRGKSNKPRLVLGTAMSAELKAEDIGRLHMVEIVADAVRAAMKDAGISDPSQIECVEIKCPAMTPARVADAGQRGRKVANTNPVVASSLAKGACALGVAVATGEVARERLSDAMINVDKSVYSSVASTSAGGEQVACRVLVIGNVEGAPGKLVAAHGVMQDQLDIRGAREAFARAGLELQDGTVSERDRPRIAAVLVNAGADYVTSVRGRRHVLHSDFLAPFSGIQAKAVAHAAVATIVGDTMFLASAGAEHQGPPGANLICVIAEA
ncbi:MAG TPA: ring-opening amidohydrolase [Casimicrobiaceae bacterium]|nr:ring-opening amidohydrolase [Casimicrobiaceae bacterium]